MAAQKAEIEFSTARRIVPEPDVPDTCLEGRNLPVPRYLSTYEMKNLLIRGAARNQDLFYPNREWGYGQLNLYNTFETMRQL